MKVQLEEVIQQNWLTRHSDSHSLLLSRHSCSRAARAHLAPILVSSSADWSEVFGSHRRLARSILVVRPPRVGTESRGSSIYSSDSWCQWIRARTSQPAQSRVKGGARRFCPGCIDWFVSVGQLLDAFDWSFGARLTRDCWFTAVESPSDDGEKKSFMTWRGLTHASASQQREPAERLTWRREDESRSRVCGSEAKRSKSSSTTATQQQQQ